MKQLKRLGLLTIVFSISLILASCTEQTKEEGDVDKVKPLDKANMDTTISPGKDFFRYANGTWLDNNPIPEEEVRWGSFNILRDKNLDKLKKMFEEAAGKEAKAGSPEQKMGDFYSSGMDTAKVEENGIKPLKPLFEKIEDIKTKDDLQNIVSELNKNGVFPFFRIFPGQDEKNSEMVIAQLYQGGLGLPDRDYYLNDDDRSKEIRKKYMDHLQKMFELLGDDEAAAKRNADAVMVIEHTLAENSRTREELREPQKNYNKTDIKGLTEISGTFNWDSYFEDIGLSKDVEINVGQPEFAEAVSKVIDQYDDEKWKSYLRWNLINSMAPYVDSKFVEQNFKFYGTVLTGQEEMKPRWKRVLSVTSGNLGELVGKLYVERYFPPEAKERMNKLVGNLKLALNDKIQNLDWMGDTTKQKATHKLETMNTKIGFPDKWRNYSDLEVSPDCYVCNIMAANNFDFDYHMNKIGKPVDPDEWHMSPQTVNAYFNPTMNEIVFPAAILQPPFFDMNADDPVNYGAIGAVIGHEMTHGFDDQGRHYDYEGNMKEWWTETDAERFQKRAQVVVEQYNQYEPVDLMNINGRMTLGENIADIGGVTVAYAALNKAMQEKEMETVDGLTPEQRFFLSYAQVWRMNIRKEELMRRLKIDVHSPAEYRVNGVMPNIDAFYQAFNVDSDDPMYLPKDERARVW